MEKEGNICIIQKKVVILQANCIKYNFCKIL